MRYIFYINLFSIYTYLLRAYEHWYSLRSKPFSHYIVSVFPCHSSTHEESCHMFQQVPVTRALCFEALFNCMSIREQRMANV